MSWEHNLAGHFKARDNKQQIGTIIGVIKQVSPLQVAIENGEIVLDEKQLYVPQILKTKQYSQTMTGKIKSFKGSSLGSITLSGEQKSVDLANLHDVEIEFEVKGSQSFELTVGHKVILTHSDDQQTWYIIDVI